MFKYSLYGLKVASEISIPEAPTVDFERSDVVIRRGSVPRPTMPAGRRYAFESNPRQSLYYVDEIGGVIVTAGERIIAEALPGAEEKGFRFILTGVALGLLFRQRGYYSLHASAVEVNGHAVGFLGVKGMGKSTLAAAFTKLGYNLVVDDLLVLNILRDNVTVIPSFSHLKLLPDALEVAVGVDPAAVPQIDPSHSKRSYSHQASLAKSAIPLSHLYVLRYRDVDNKDADMPDISEMSNQDRLLSLIANDYVARIDNNQVDNDMLKSYKNVYNSVIVKVLEREKNIKSIFESADLVISDIANFK